LPNIFLEEVIEMALKKTPTRDVRIRQAKEWISTYTGKDIAKGYRRHFGLSPLCAVKDLQILGYEFTSEYINSLKADEINRGKKNNEITEPSDKPQRKFKNHILSDGRLLQTNKKFSNLKEKQKILIAEWFREAYKYFYETHNKFPSDKMEKESVISEVYEKIQSRDIWIPYSEIRKYFHGKQTRLKNSIMKEFQVQKV